MKKNKTIQKEKYTELLKFRALVLATIDYSLQNKETHFKTADFDPIEYYKELKVQTEELFQKGRLTKLKQWFRDFTEMYIETKDLKFNKYLQNTTNYDINIFESYFQRIDKIINRGKILTDNQFYEINTLVNQLCQIEPVDKEKIKKLNELLSNYKNK